VKNTSLKYFLILLSFLSLELKSQDSLRVINIWNTDEYQKKQESSLDTSLAYFEIYRFDFRKSFSNNYLGNIGLASQSNLYFLRNSSNFLFANASLLNMITQNDIKYFNTKRHFTNLSFYSNLSKKNNNQVLDIIHTQNVNKDLNFGIMYKMISSTGQYSRETSSNNSFALFSSYDGNKYKYSGNFIYNNIKNENNGGLNFSSIDAYLIKTNSSAIPIWLSQSNYVLSNKELNFTHNYNFNLNTADSLDSIAKNNKTKKIQILHSINYSYNRFKYYNTANTFYYKFLIDSNITFDSTFTNLLNNKISFNYVFEKDSLTKIYSLFGGYELENNYYYNNKKYFANSFSGVKYAFEKTDNLSINLDVKYYLSGRKQSDLLVNMYLSKPILKSFLWLNLELNHNQKTPNYFEEHYFSNNASWDTTFINKIVSTYADLSVSNKKHNFYLGINYGIYDNLVYFKDTLENDGKLNILPFQETSTINYLAIYLEKDFNLKNWIINNKIAYQNSGNNAVISIPQIAIYNSTTFTFNLVKNVLRGGIGYNLYYYSQFNAENYNPSTNMFYSQTSQNIGNYPMFDAFFKMKLKRARLFFMFEHVSFGLLGNSNYYAGVNQLMNPRIFKFGVSWSFYD
jgi:hypothetical protein